VLTIYGGFGVVGAVFYPFYAVAMIDRGLSAGELGLLTAATALVSSAVGPAWGHLADRVVGRRAGLAIGEISSAIGILLFALWRSLAPPQTVLPMRLRSASRATVGRALQ
jgi:MFS family permease